MEYFDKTICVNKIFNGTVHFVHNSFIIASKGRHMFYSNNMGEDWEKLFSFSLNKVERIKNVCNLTRRLFRSGVHIVISIRNNKYIFWAYSSIYIFNFTDRTLIKSDFNFPGSRLLNLCSAGGNILYLGEYKNNMNREPIHIYKSTDGGIKWEIAWKFTSIRHIHGIFFDSYTENIWVTTGDNDDESAIWMTRDHFKTLEKIVGGSQQTRVIQLIFTEMFIYYGTDTPIEKNRIYRIHRDTYTIECLQEVEGSIFYGCKVGESIYFSTACEPSKINELKEVIIWRSFDGNIWERLLKFGKDFYPMKLFQYGQIRFPNGQWNEKYLWITPFATKHDQKSIQLRFKGPKYDKKIIHSTKG